MQKPLHLKFVLAVDRTRSRLERVVQGDETVLTRMDCRPSRHQPTSSPSSHCSQTGLACCSLGSVKNDSFKMGRSHSLKMGNKGGCLKRPLHLAYHYDPIDPSKTVRFLRLQAAFHEVPCMEEVLHDRYIVNLYRVGTLLSVKRLGWKTRDTPDAAAKAFEIAEHTVKTRLREKKIYVIRDRQRDVTKYCEVHEPDREGQYVYKLVLSTQTSQGTWDIFLMDLDERHVDCKRASASWWKFANDLKGDDAVVTALRYAVNSLGV